MELEKNMYKKKTRIHVWYIDLHVVYVYANLGKYTIHGSYGIYNCIYTHFLITVVVPALSRAYNSAVHGLTPSWSFFLFLWVTSHVVLRGKPFIQGFTRGTNDHNEWHKSSWHIFWNTQNSDQNGVCSFFRGYGNRRGPWTHQFFVHPWIERSLYIYSVKINIYIYMFTYIHLKNICVCILCIPYFLFSSPKKNSAVWPFQKLKKGHQVKR